MSVRSLKKWRKMYQSPLFLYLYHVDIWQLLHYKGPENESRCCFKFIIHKSLEPNILILVSERYRVGSIVTQIYLKSSSFIIIQPITFSFCSLNVVDLARRSSQVTFIFSRSPFQQFSCQKYNSPFHIACLVTPIQSYYI